MSVCQVCGEPLRIGEFPCISTPRPHGSYANHVVEDSIPGGFVQEHFGHEPETFYSKKEMARRAKELGLVEFVRWSGPNDRHVTRWDAPDAYTLQAAAALVERM